MTNRKEFVEGWNARNDHALRMMLLRCKLHTWLDRVMTWAGL